MNELALFAGVGGGILGGQLLGWRARCAVEIDPYCRSVLLARQRDGALPRFPIWDDVCTFDGGPWRGHIDVVSGGFPCQDISSAGKREGLEGTRSGLWREAIRIVGEVRPTWVLLENSPLLRSSGLPTILTELARMGYDARWGVLGARHVGAPHKRDRIWIVAHTNGSGERALPKHAEVAGPSANGLRGWWDRLPNLEGMDDGMANRVERIKATGNGQVPAVAALAWRVLTT
jgi:DNA (cytosine-5)-methyltransferase 1